MITDSPHRYRRLGLQDGRDPEVLERAVANASLVERQGLASVLTLKHLAWQSGASYIYLRRIIQRSEDPYREILRRRRNGAVMRTISAPDPPLMSVQRWILKNIVRHMSVHPSSCAYMPGDSIARCATLHLGAAWLIKMDVHDFFHSIDERQIFSVFRDVGYGNLISLELARVCTRAALGPRLDLNSIPIYTVSSYRTPRLGVLPQGAPTSGPLANVVMNECDRNLNDLGREYGLTYTRYADDVVFSSGGTFSHQRASELVKRVGVVFKQHGLSPHEAKTRVSPPGSRHVVLGLLLDDEAVRLPRETRQRIRDHIRGVRKFGLADHSRHRGFVSMFGFVNHVNGLIAFAKDVEPQFASECRAEWLEALDGQHWRKPISW
jgi:RNA-directed DNA polymerase